MKRSHVHDRFVKELQSSLEVLEQEKADVDESLAVVSTELVQVRKQSEGNGRFGTNHKRQCITNTPQRRPVVSKASAIPSNNSSGISNTLHLAEMY